MKPSSLRCFAVVLVITVLSQMTMAAPIPSRADDAQPSARDVHVATIENVLARQEVSEALASHGLSAEQVEHRLARLSDEDLRHLASNLEQIQVAGEQVPEYIWWLAGGLLAVLILAAIF